MTVAARHTGATIAALACLATPPAAAQTTTLFQGFPIDPSTTWTEAVDRGWSEFHANCGLAMRDPNALIQMASDHVAAGQIAGIVQSPDGKHIQLNIGGGNFTTMATFISLDGRAELTCNVIAMWIGSLMQPALGNMPTAMEVVDIEVVAERLFQHVRAASGATIAGGEFQHVLGTFFNGMHGGPPAELGHGVTLRSASYSMLPVWPDSDALVHASVQSSHIILTAQRSIKAAP